jgi:tetratricopeptide (TPR) repeat protein
MAALASAAPPIPTLLSAEADEWYRWRIVLSCQASPLLGPEIREQLAREIKSAISPSVAGYAEIDVVDLAKASAKEPLWAAFESQGWEALAKAEFREITGIKTHFVRVTVRGGVYTIQTRQHDGHSGLLSPFVRSQETRASDQIGRIAGQLIHPDFGVVGTIVGGGETDAGGVQVRLRGSNRWKTDDAVKPGDLFAIAEITQPTDPIRRGKNDKPTPPAKAVGTMREATYLKALTTPSDGVFRASIVTRFATGLRVGTTHLQGFRVLRYDGATMPVKVRVVTETGKPHPRATLITVQGTDADYGITPTARDGFSYDPRDGLFKSSRPLKSIACLVVGLSPTYSERFPVPIVNGDIVTVKLKNDEQQARKAELENATFNLRLRMGEALSSLTSLYSTIGKMAGESRNRDALDRLRDGLKSSEAVEQALTAELTVVKKMPGANVSESEDQLKQYAQWRDRLKTYEERLAAAAKLDPVRMEKGLRAKDLTERIKALREEGEIPEALELFDELIQLTGQDDLKLDKEKLVKSWEPIDTQHRAAREFLLVKWPTLQTIEDFAANIGKFREAAETMMKKGDRLGCRKMLNAFNPAYAKLKALVETIDPSVEADKDRLARINASRTELEPLEAKLREWLKNQSPPK